jgi:hypothetical protein
VIATLVTSATGRLVEVPSTVTTTWSPTTATETSWLPPSASETVQVPADVTVGVVGVSIVGAVVTTGAVVELAPEASDVAGAGVVDPAVESVEPVVGSDPEPLPDVAGADDGDESPEGELVAESEDEPVVVVDDDASDDPVEEAAVVVAGADSFAGGTDGTALDSPAASVGAIRPSPCS